MSKTVRYDPVAKEMLTSGKYKKKVIPAKKGKAPYKRQRKENLNVYL